MMLLISTVDMSILRQGPWQGAGGAGWDRDATPAGRQKRERELGSGRKLSAYLNPLQIHQSCGEWNNFCLLKDGQWGQDMFTISVGSQGQVGQPRNVVVGEDDGTAWRFESGHDGGRPGWPAFPDQAGNTLCIINNVCHHDAWRNLVYWEPRPGGGARVGKSRMT